ncbi:MAG: hypothetical protein ACHQCI_04485, partial [Solirubrobacterales bacterium]
MLAVLAALAVLASSASAASPKSGPPDATVKIRVGHLHGGKAPIMSTVPVVGTLSPFVPGQKVEVSFYLNGHRIERKTAKVSKGKRGSGSFRAKIRVAEGGKYAASAKHVATPELGADSTVRKSWRVSFPALHE